MSVCVCCSLNRVLKRFLTVQMSYKQRLKRKGISPCRYTGKNIPDIEKSECKEPKKGNIVTKKALSKVRAFVQLLQKNLDEEHKTQRKKITLRLRSKRTKKQFI